MNENYRSVNDFDTNEIERDKFIKSGNCGHTLKSQTNGSVTGKWNNIKENRESSSTINNQRERKTRQLKVTVDNITEQQKQQDEYCQRYIIYIIWWINKNIILGTIELHLYEPDGGQAVHVTE